MGLLAERVGWGERCHAASGWKIAQLDTMLIRLKFKDL